MSKQTEAMKLALGWIEAQPEPRMLGALKVINALREAMAEQPAQQEPVACKTLCELCVKRGYHFCANAAQTTPIPSPPASKPWLGLTPDDIRGLCANTTPSTWDISLCRLVEKFLKEKNNA